MRRRLPAVLASAAFMVTSGAGMAHHSFAMFDQDNPIELEGIVQEFKYTNPHTFILLQVKGPDGSVTVWNLEGATPGTLARDGWSAKTIQAGDELKMKVAPLRSGAPGGSWTPEGTKYRDGRAIVVAH